MTHIIRLELAGRRDLSYQLLVRAQRKLVDRRLYRWHWTLTAQSLKLLRAGLCP